MTCPSSMTMLCCFDNFATNGYNKRSASVFLGAYPTDPGSSAADPLVEPVVPDLNHRVSNSRCREHQFCKKNANFKIIFGIFELTFIISLYVSILS